ncbi:hypothetical protein AB3G33_09690 [Flavobacterium sp. WC2421]|jgi:uncharacterized membrane protein|uniref:Uncharacterized protein n=2 Tax=unclassified Flavobacterium TaxID=196869 RepID=A0AB39W975_9FLAO
MKEFKLENSTKIETGFKTPDHYFEKFSAELLLKLPHNEPKVIPFFKRRNTIFMLVAALFVIALMIPILNTTQVNTMTELDETTLENYLSYQTNVNQYDLINILDAKDIDKIDAPVALEEKTIEDILVDNANLEHFIIE